jgi:prepilin-type N-terminal cleavage/methylation domain-containing protein
MITKQKKGFTLIEILIVVAIIAILASVVLVGLGPTQQAGRDARRISDLSEVENGLELYYNKCGYYPGNSATACDPNGGAGYAAMATSLIGSSGFDLGISSVPVDPSNAGTHVYSYGTNSGANPDSYVLGAVLENTNNSIFATYKAPSDATNDMSPTAFSCSGTGDYCVSL